MALAEHATLTAVINTIYPFKNVFGFVSPTKYSSTANVYASKIIISKAVSAKLVHSPLTTTQSLKLVNPTSFVEIMKN